MNEPLTPPEALRKVLENFAARLDALEAAVQQLRADSEHHTETLRDLLEAVRRQRERWESTFGARPPDDPPAGVH